MSRSIDMERINMRNLVKKRWLHGLIVLLLVGFGGEKFLPVLQSVLQETQNNVTSVL